MKSSLVEIKIGDKILHHERNEIVEVVDIKLTPNGTDDNKLVALLFVRRPNGNILSGTSDRFGVIADRDYDELYPSEHLFKLK
jgi:hypothetical protein